MNLGFDFPRKIPPYFDCYMYRRSSSYHGSRHLNLQEENHNKLCAWWMVGGRTRTNSWNCLIRERKKKKSSIISFFLCVCFGDGGDCEVLMGVGNWRTCLIWLFFFDFFYTAPSLADKIEMLHRRGYCVWAVVCLKLSSSLIATKNINFTPPPKGAEQENKKKKPTRNQLHTHTRSVSDTGAYS